MTGDCYVFKFFRPSVNGAAQVQRGDQSADCLSELFHLSFVFFLLLQLLMEVTPDGLLGALAVRHAARERRYAFEAVPTHHRMAGADHVLSLENLHKLRSASWPGARNVG